MEEQSSPNPVDQKPSAHSENPEIQNPAASSEIATGEILGNPSRVLVELKPGTSTDNGTTSKSYTPEYASCVILSETEPILPENGIELATIVGNISGPKPDISSESPTYSDADLFRSPKIPSISVSPPGSPVDPEISNPSENPTDPLISNPSENTPRGPSATQVSQSQTENSSILLGFPLFHIMYVVITTYTLIFIAVALGIKYDSGWMMAIYCLCVPFGIGALLFLKYCYKVIAQIIADYRSRNYQVLPSNTSNPSPPEILQKAETTESVVEASLPEAVSLAQICYDIKLPEKDEDAAQEVVEKSVDLTQEKETVRLRHVEAEDK